MLTAIICATDLSHRSARALERAAQLAHQHRLPLHVIHVIDPEIPESLWQAQGDQIKTEIRETLNRVASTALGEARIEILTGRPSMEIAVYAGAIKGSLLVLGYPRVSEGGNLSFASFSAGRILRTAMAPVLVVKGEANAPYRRVCVATDLSPYSARGAALAAELVPDGEITMIHAYHVPYKGFLTGEDTRQGCEESERKKLEKFVEDLRQQREQGKEAPQFLSTLHVREGEVHHVLRAEVKSSGAELLVLGTHGRTGLSRAFFGSIAEDMLATMPCDILIAVPND